MAKVQSVYSKLPSIQDIDQFLASQNQESGKAVRNSVQEILNRFRQDKALLENDETTKETLLQFILSELTQDSSKMIRVINGTGTIIHTNLGRSLISAEVWEKAGPLVQSYTNLEFSLKSGKRGARLENVKGLLCTLTGAEDALVVNNNASAVMLALSCLSQDQEIIISRGELVEIGGAFRVPEIIELSGGKLHEIGTTNRTHLKDYKKAVNEDTGLILKVHTSNYKIVGFTKSVGVDELAPLAKELGVPLMEDAGSGALVTPEYPEISFQKTISSSIKHGVDVISFSGDKLLGGPQAGIIVGKTEYLEAMKNHPLYRALRCDKTTMILLEQTLLAYAKGEQQKLVPTQRMLNESVKTIKERAEKIASAVNNSEWIEPVHCYSTPGGGTLPGAQMPSFGLKISKAAVSAQSVLNCLREQNPPVIGRIEDNKLVIDCRTILDEQIELLAKVIQQTIASIAS